MKTDNLLSQEFLMRHPVEAARTLEQVSVEAVAILFNNVSAQTTVPVLNTMLPDIAAACLGKMQALSAARLLAELPVTRAARIYRLLSDEKKTELSAHMPDKNRKRIQRFLSYSTLSAGDLMDPSVNELPDDLSVSDAIRRIERHQEAVSCEIFIVNNSHQLLGSMELGKLLTSGHHQKLHDIMNRSIRPVSAHANAASLLSHPGWAGRQRLPVVERDNTIVGVLGRNRLLEATGEEPATAHDPLENVLSLASLYWLSVTQLLDTFFNVERSREGERR